MPQLQFHWKNVLPSIIQTESSECGLACLAMVMNYYGHKIDIHSLRYKYSVSQHGITFKSLISLANKVNFSCRPIKLDISALKQINMPAILHWDMNHFVVLAEIKNKKIVIHDPSVGVRQYTYENIGKHFTGIALELIPTDEFEVKNNISKLKLNDLWNKTYGLKQSIIQIILLSIIMQSFALALPFYSQLVIDNVLVRFDLNLLTILAIGFLIVTILNVSTDLIRSFVVLHLSNSLGFQLAANVNKHLLRLPLKYFNSRHMGDVVSRFGSIFKIKEFVTSGIIEVLIDGLMVIGTLTIILIYNIKLSILVFTILIINSIFKFSFFKSLRNENEELVFAQARENTTFMENVRCIQGIKLFGKEIDRDTVWQNIFVDVTNKSINVQKLNIYIRISRTLIFGIEKVVILYLASIAVISGDMSIGMVVAFITYKDQLYKRFFNLVDKYFDFKLLDIHFSRLADIVHTKSEPIHQIEYAPSKPLNANAHLQLKDISFKYSDESPYLFQNLHLSVNSGDSIAIIGPTGCGKSTLMKLILGLYEMNSGEIFFEDISIHHAGIDNYRSNISGVLQDDSLLSGSIYENISFFDSNADTEKVHYAAVQACIADEIYSMPMRYETLVGNMGAALSGGQIQRILLARAFYKESKVIILDEATSHLDLQTESKIMQCIKNLKITKIMVAHRPHSFLSANYIFELTSKGLILVDKEKLLKSINLKH